MPKPTFFNLPEEKRARILAVAVDEFATHGYKTASISRMVAAAGIAKGSFYQYFDDKDDLYEYIVCTLIADRKLELYKEEFEQLKELSLTQYLRRVFRRQVREFHETPQLLKIGVDILQLIDQPIYRRIMGRYEGVRSTYYLPFIQHEVDQGEIDPRVNAELLNVMLVSLGQYMITRYSADDLHNINYALIDEIVDDLEYILMHGIYTPQTPGVRGNKSH